MEGCAERRAIALDSSIENVLVEAGVRAAEQLKSSRPKLSAATLNKLTNAIPLLFGVLAFAAMCTTSGMIALSVLVVLPTAFRIWVVVHTVATSSNTNRNLSPRDESDDELPMYSVIAALHREAAVVDQLLSAIERLDYPAEKLDVIVAVEADDHGTRAAITARKHRIPIVVVPVAPAALRTKPKALNVALPFARGVFTVIYDAEDRPERNQLRRALQAFRSAGNDLACVQARLCTDTKMTWLSRYFSAEYAGHFDIFLPRLAALGLPLPLGGSSNHFRTATLREVGGWDPHNVTEDADLGMRFARFGYRSGVIDSTTYEEAPTRIGAWLGQRTRWFKGWMRPVKKFFFRVFARLNADQLYARARSQHYRNNIACTLTFVHVRINNAAGIPWNAACPRAQHTSTKFSALVWKSVQFYKFDKQFRSYVCRPSYAL